MKRLMLLLFSLACMAALVMASCSDKNSQEACRYETTMALDKGSYDAVIASPCADSMQLGAAYFGKAGFDTTDVINTLIDAKNVTDKFSLYMTSLIGAVNDATLTDLDNAHGEFSGVPVSDVNRQSARFNLGLVDSVKGLSLLKLLVAEQGAAALNRSCDRNGNNKADGIDAASCALLVSAGQPCPADVTVTTTISGIKLRGKSDTYRGLLIQVTGTGSATSCPANNEYQKLLADASGKVATLSGDVCTETSPDATRSWPCPLESNGTSVDLVGAFNSSLDSAVTSMNESSSGGSIGDAQDSIYKVKQDNCCTGAGETWDPANPGQCACDALELEAYFQKP